MAEQEGTLLDFGNHSAEDLEFDLLNDGDEVEVVILRAENYLNQKNMKRSLKVTVEAVGEDNVDDITFYIGLPAAGDTPKEDKKKRRRLAEFRQCFDIDEGEQDLQQDVVGKHGEIIVGQEEYEGKRKNTLRALVLPK